MKKYDEYKDSGVAWIGDVPKHWEICKLKHYSQVFGRIGFRGYNQTDLVNEGEGAITLSPSNMQNGILNYDKCSYLSWKKYYESPEIMIYNDDVLFVKTGSTYGKISYVADLPMEATINPQIVVFKNIKGNNKYLYYLLSNDIVQMQVSLSVGGSTIPTLSQESILNYIVPLAPKIEQTAIATYLDTHCAKIDNLISIQQKRIALLQELKQSVITHAVTKGLNPNVEMKLSGVEWIGDVPKHWEYCRFKDFMLLQTTASNSNNKIGLENIESRSGMFVYTGSEFEGNGIAFSNQDIIYGKLRPYLQKVWLATFEGNAVGDFFVFRMKSNSCPSFVKYLMLSDGYTKETDGSTVGAKMPRVSSDFILTMHYCLPPIIEQAAIASYLDHKCATIDTSISNAQHQIDLLQEYKQSLITEVVTGKRKVTDN